MPTVVDVCAPPALSQSALLTHYQAGALAGTFKVLANDSRLRLLHALARAGELCVTELAEAVEMSPQAVSNQLQRLTDRKVVAARRDGLFVYYRLEDPCVVELLNLAFCLTVGGADAEARQ